MRRTLLPLLIAALCVPAAKPAKTYQVGRIRTSLGEILFVLYDQTPRHKASFIKLARSHYWDSLTFNRVIKNFVAQGGCPDTPQGFGGSPYLLAPEFNDSLKHIYGAVGAGRDDNPGQLSAGCQFYIVANRQGLARLDNHYTVYGRVFKGMDVVEAIVSVPKDSTDTPLTPIRLHVDVVDMPADQIEAQSTPTAQERQIQPLLDEMVVAANAHDTDRFLAPYAHDADFVFVFNGDVTTGFANLRALQLKFWNNGQTDVVYTRRGPATFTVLTPTVVLVTDLLSSRRTLPTGEIKTTDVTVTMVWQKRPEGWRIVQMHESSVR